MTSVHSLSWLPHHSTKKVLSRIIVLQTLLRLLQELSVFKCVSSHFENMVEMFSVTFVFFFFFIFCLGLLISATNSVSADLGKPMANLKTTLVRIPLRIEQLKEPKHYPCLLSFSEEENPLIRRAQLMLNENSQPWEAW